MNGFPAPRLLAKARQRPEVEDVEAEGCDEGRVFVHLRAGYYFDRGTCEYDRTTSCTVGSAAELRAALAQIRARS